MGQPQSPVALSRMGPGDREVEHYPLATVRWEVQNEKIPRLRLGTRVAIMALIAKPRDRDRKTKAKDTIANCSSKGQHRSEG